MSKIIKPNKGFTKLFVKIMCSKYEKYRLRNLLVYNWELGTK